MIDALLILTVGRGQLGTVNKEETSPVSVVGFSLEFGLLRCLHVVVE